MKLTARERDVVTMLGAGWDKNYVAKALGISPWTVRNIMAKLYEKNDVMTMASTHSLYELLIKLHNDGEISLLNGG